MSTFEKFTPKMSTFLIYEKEILKIYSKNVYIFLK